MKIKVFKIKNYKRYVLGGVVLTAIPIFYFTNITTLNIENFDFYNNDVESVIKENEKEKVFNNELPKSKPAEREVKAIYLTAHSVANPAKLDSMIKMINSTELNAIVMDLKDYTGHVYFDTDVELAKENNLIRPVLKTLDGIIKKLHKNNIYVIARITVFQDPALAQARPDLALKDVSGGLWKDWKGLNWVDTTKQEVWDYNIALAKDAATRGFDELNFDYIRFPSDGPISRMRFENYDGSFKKHEILAGFFSKLYTELKDEPVYLSADLFGLTTIRTDDMSIGQLLEDAAPNFNYIMPMMYPSHYPSGFYGFKNPANNPYAVIQPGVKIAEERIKKVPNNIAKIRPWIQDFDIGAVYGREKVQAQIQAVKDGGGFGFASWNARNVYAWGDY